MIKKFSILLCVLSFAIMTSTGCDQQIKTSESTTISSTVNENQPEPKPSTQVKENKKEESSVILFTNVNIFDGINEQILQNASVLVEGNLIKKVSTEPIEESGAKVIDGGGRTLMPGLIDMHSHLCIRNGLIEFRDYDAMAAGAYTQTAMLDYLEQGFTTARDAGCNILGIAKAVNNQIIPGPRLFPSGAFLSQRLM